MSDDTDNRAEEKLSALLAEENHYGQLKRVFGTPDGLDVLEWLLTDVCGYWRGRLDTEREIGKFELGRLVFNQVCLGDIDIVHTLLDRRRKKAEDIRLKEKRAIEKAAE